MRESCEQRAGGWVDERDARLKGAVGERTSSVALISLTKALSLLCLPACAPVGLRLREKSLSHRRRLQTFERRFDLARQFPVHFTGPYPASRTYT